MKNLITVHQSIIINRSPDIVWDFTQDYSKRLLWDRSIKEATIVSNSPELVVAIKSTGLSANFHYKLNDCPFKTSLVMSEVQSPIIASGGGSWIYENIAGGTRWTQTNSIVLKDVWWLKLCQPLLRRMFNSETNKAMRKAKVLIEREESHSTDSA